MMKKIFTILAFFVLTFALKAQNGYPYECKAGYMATKDSLDNMELMMAMVVSDEESPFYINLETGESDSWLYVYRDKTDTTYNALFIVLKGDDQWMLFPVAENLQLPEGARPFDGIDFIGSNVFMSALAKNDVFKEYIAKNPDPVEKQIILVYYPVGFDETIPEKYVNQYLWLFMTPGIQCVTNAVTGETDCLLIPESDIKDNNSLNIQFSPNPASDYIDIRMTDGIPENIEILDNLGNTVKKIDGSSSSLQRISVSDLNSGLYFVKIKYKNNHIVRKLSIVR